MIIIGLKGNFNLYIHPRYHVFTFLMLGCGAILLTIAAGRYVYKSQTDIEFRSYIGLTAIFMKWLLGYGSWVVVAALIVLIVTPPVSLSSSLADRKSELDSATVEYVESSEWFDNPKTIYQLSNVLQTHQGVADQTGKKITLTGFVRAGLDSRSDDIFLLSRFVMACCAIDATPVSVKAYLPNWRKEYAINQWLEVRGKITELKLYGNEPVVVILVNDAKKITQPKTPYDYFQ